MSDNNKPRVYQGVRVKTTVKELLQRHRAREANSKKLKMISQACLELQDLCQSTFPNVIPSGRYVDPPSAITAANASSCGARSLQMRTAHYQAADAACSIQLQGDAFSDTQPQFGAVTFPSSCSNQNVGGGSVYNANHNNQNNNNNNSSSGSGSSSPLSPSHSFPLNWYYGLSSDADYYGHGMAPVSPAEFQKLCSPLDCNSYSPQDSFSSSSSSCYDSPTRMESSHQGFASEQYQHYQHCNYQDCYCLPHCWSGQQESFSAPECTSYYNNTDYPYTCLVEESYRRDLQMSPEMCYNVL